MNSSRKILLVGIGSLFTLAAMCKGGRELTAERVTFKVTDKERINNKDGGKYLVYVTKENGKEEVFENTDAWLSLKFNSSDVQGHLKVNETYEAKVVGFRSGLFSMHRNIVDVKDVPKSEEPKNK